MKSLHTKILRVILLLSPLLLLSFPLSAQFFEVSYPGEGYPVFLNYYDGKQKQQIAVPDWQQNPVISLEGTDKTMYFDLSFVTYDNPPKPSDPRAEIIEWYEPGRPVEGDLPSAAKFSLDGSMFAFVYQYSDNVIFYDAATYAVLATVQVASEPLNIKMGAAHAYVCCHEGQGIAVISLDDFSVTNFIPVDGTPCQVELSPGEDTAYIACDSYVNGWLIAYDLNSNEVIYRTEEPYFHHWGWTSDFGRLIFAFTKFRLSPRGDRILCSYTRPIWPALFDAHTGQLIDTLRFGGCRGTAFSDTGDTLYIYSNHDDSVMMYRYYSNDLTLIDSIKAFAPCYWGLADYSDLAFNNNRSVIITSDNANDRYCIFNFNTHTLQTIEEPMLWMDSPIFSSFDGDYAVSLTEWNVKFIDFWTGDVFSSWMSGCQPGMTACVSPLEDKMFVSNLPFYHVGSHKGNEYLFALDFDYVDNVYLDSAIVCGTSPEADVPANAGLSPDGEKILVANELSFNLSVIDRYEHLTDSLLPFAGIMGVQVAAGKNQAMVYGQAANKTWIISLDNYEILAELEVGGIRDGFISSDEQFGYLVEYMGSFYARLTKISINGTSSEVIDMATIRGGYCMYHYTGNIDIWTTSALSPDGRYVLVGSEDNDIGPVINIYDTETLDLLTSVRCPDVCIWSYAFTDDSERVIVIGPGNIVVIIYLKGADSYVENEISLYSRSFSAAYNPVDHFFYVAEKNNFVHIVDPLSGEIVESFNTMNDKNWGIGIDQNGMPLVLTATSMFFDGENYAMPGQSAKLYYDSEYDLFVSPVPGPDAVVVFDPKLVGIQQYSPETEIDIRVFPNPAGDQIKIQSSSEIIRVKFCKTDGTEVYTGNFNEREIGIPATSLATGLYVLSITTNRGNYSRKVLLR
jgi:DNA-binding beta-propeller fold protein YncE